MAVQRLLCRIQRRKTQITARLRGGAAGSPGPDSQWPKGFHSILEKRAMEALQTGQAQTAYLRWGDTVRIDLKGRDGGSPLGVLEQRVLEPDQD